MSGVHKLPPMKETVMGAGSSFAKDSRAWVGWPLMSLIPKISEEGNEADTCTARLGEVDGDSSSSSTGS